MFSKWLLLGTFSVAIAYLMQNYDLDSIPTIEEIKNHVVDSIILLKSTYFSRSKVPDKQKVKASPLRLFTEVELKKYTGENNSKIYLAILGKVFDVTKGRKHYGKSGTYHGFAGRDASKAFITGDFSATGLTDDLSDISSSDLSDLRDWLQKYESDYIYKGKLVGRFYDKNGRSTQFLKSIEEKLAIYDNEKKLENDYKVKFPPCNVEWIPETGGTRLWCSKQSGGIKRNWVGVPRKFYEPGATSPRCACLNSAEGSRVGRFLLYEGCKPDSASCFLKVES